tara:strand:+ start:189 stop:428 length:240 start_codon:yes stop_codon:yes gene_type:complete
MVEKTEGGNPLVTATQIEQKRKGFHGSDSEQIKVVSQILHGSRTYSYRFTFHSFFGDKNVSESVTFTLDEDRSRIYSYR